jgi:hypothetical protein
VFDSKQRRCCSFLYNVQTASGASCFNCIRGVRRTKREAKHSIFAEVKERGLCLDYPHIFNGMPLDFSAKRQTLHFTRNCICCHTYCEERCC